MNATPRSAVATSDEPALVRIKAAFTATAIAESLEITKRAVERHDDAAFVVEPLGHAVYARRSGASEPAALLRVAASDARILAPFAPRLGEALLRYPAEQSPTSISQIYWVKRQVQGRPTPILIHHLVDVTPALALYVGLTFLYFRPLLGAFGSALLIAVAWGTSVGGVGTPLGGAHNLLDLRVAAALRRRNRGAA